MPSGPQGLRETGCALHLKGMAGTAFLSHGTGQSRHSLCLCHSLSQSPCLWRDFCSVLFAKSGVGFSDAANWFADGFDGNNPNTIVPTDLRKPDLERRSDVGLWDIWAEHSADPHNSGLWPPAKVAGIWGNTRNCACWLSCTSCTSRILSLEGNLTSLAALIRWIKTWSLEWWLSRVRAIRFNPARLRTLGPERWRNQWYRAKDRCLRSARLFATDTVVSTRPETDEDTHKDKWEQCDESEKHAPQEPAWWKANGRRQSRSNQSVFGTLQSQKIELKLRKIPLGARANRQIVPVGENQSNQINQCSAHCRASGNCKPKSCRNGHKMAASPRCTTGFQA